MEEVWKDVVGYEGLYQVSNLGGVRSLYRPTATHRHRNGKVLAPILIRSTGYLKVSLYVNNQRKMGTIHRLVAIAFIQRIKNKPHVNHKNGVKADNRIENLEWVTQKQNQQHAVKIGLMKKGDDHHFTIFKSIYVQKLVNLNSRGASVKQIALKEGLGYETTWHLIKRRAAQLNIVPK